LDVEEVVEVGVKELDIGNREMRMIL